MNTVQEVTINLVDNTYNQLFNPSTDHNADLHV